MTNTLTVEAASEYDFMLLLDGSGSMGDPVSSTNAKSRWDYMQESATAIARFLDKVDTDGIDVVLFGGTTTLHEGVTGDKVKDIFSATSPRGSTPLHEAVKIAIDKQKASGKKTVALVFTDGVPNDQAEVARLITDASNNIEHDEDLTFLMVQVGDDKGATAYLTALDDQLSGKFDIVDTVTIEEADKYEPLDLIAKAIAD